MAFRIKLPKFISSSNFSRKIKCAGGLSLVIYQTANCSRQDSCKTLCASIADEIAAEIEVRQRWALRQHSCKNLCPNITDVIAAEIEVSQRWALR